MFRKLRRLFRTHKPELQKPEEVIEEPRVYSYDEVLEIIAEVKVVAYNDGKRDGLSIAREQATKSLKEILWQQNKKK